MIEHGGSFLDKYKEFNRRISPSDWRYSAAIVGMMRYFDERNLIYDNDEQHLYYNFEDINKDRDGDYLLYVEKRYYDKMHHKVVEDILINQELNDAQKKLINEKLKSKAVSIMKKIFKDVDENDYEEIQNLIVENRMELIENTFKNAKTGYAKFSNSNKFRDDKDVVCRLVGYYVDTGRKTKALSFGFDDNTRVFNDEIEFDFIPFAFTDNRESIFINNNRTIQLLKNTNDKTLAALKENDKNFRDKIFYSMSEGSEFTNFDVELIVKDMDKDYYETIFIRKESVDIFEKIRGFSKKDSYIEMALNKIVKVNDNYYIRIMDIVTDCVLNMLFLDGLIDMLMTMNGYSFVISQLIRINRVIYEMKYKKEDKMIYSGGYKNVRDCANAVKAHMKKKNIEKKLDSYRYKLISALVANDKNRFMEIMLQLSSYTETPFDFLHNLILRFGEDKNLAYDFVNQLNYFSLSENDNIKKER